MACCGKNKNKKNFGDLVKDKINSSSKVILPVSLQIKKEENKQKLIERIAKNNSTKLLTDPVEISKMTNRQIRIQRRNERILLRNEKSKMLQETVLKRQTEALARNSIIVQKQTPPSN